jgi:hypothetical protein
MIRLSSVLVGVVLVAAVAGCTLLLPTDQIIVPCQSQADCDANAGAGFVCEENACLPADEGTPAETSG